jgi:PTH1 family peptidyl-tRNA hydrolase
MKLIVGLGNPGKTYQSTRHNIGFMFVDKVVNKLNGKFSLDRNKKAEIYETYIGNEKVIFIKPQTYMNASGEAVSLVKNFYKLDTDDILVIYDDLDLEVGRIKIRPSGSSGGHRGMQSIIDALNTTNIKRVRIGISRDNDVIDYVLGTFSKDDRITIDLALDKGYDIIYDFLHKTMEELMSKYN